MYKKLSFWGFCPSEGTHFCFCFLLTVIYFNNMIDLTEVSFIHGFEIYTDLFIYVSVWRKTNEKILLCIYHTVFLSLCRWRIWNGRWSRGSGRSRHKNSSWRWWNSVTIERWTPCRTCYRCDALFSTFSQSVTVVKMFILFYFFCLFDVMCRG